MRMVLPSVVAGPRGRPPRGTIMRTHPMRRSGRGPGLRRALLAATLALGTLAPVTAASALPAPAGPTGDPDRAAAGYLLDQLAADADPSPSQLADAILAFAATGTAGDAASEAYDLLAAQADGLPLGLAAKTALAAAVQGQDPADVGGVDLETQLRDAVDEDGLFAGSTQLFDHALAVLALERTDAGAPPATVDALAAAACDDGAYTFDGNCEREREPDVTGLAVQGLLAAGADADDQVAWLLAAQDDDGAFSAYDTPNVNSTAVAAQALRAAGEDDAADDGAAFVRSLFADCDAPVAVRGSFDYAPTIAGSGVERVLATSQAVFATAPSLDQLDGTAATPDASRLACSEAFCPSDAGISVVVDLTDLDPDAGVEVRCATDLPEDPNGFDVLRAAGFDLTTQTTDFGEALCAIDGLPQLEEDECFVDAGFWSYWSAERGGAWTGYQVGGAGSSPQVGGIEGWAWSSGDMAPPRVSTTPLAEREVPFDRGIARACVETHPRAFDDVDTSNVHDLAIRCLAAAEIALGTGDRAFSPARDVTRGQIASLLVRAYEEATGAALPSGSSDFADVEGTTHQEAIEALTAAGVIRGQSETRFAPNDPLTRGQMASLLQRFLDHLDTGSVDGSFPADRGASDVFTDVPGTTHAAAIDLLAGEGVVQGRPDGTFGPGLDVRRDQVSSFVARALDLAVEGGLADPVA